MITGLIYSLYIFLISVLVTALIWVRNLFTKKVSKKVKEASSVNDAIKYRKQLKWIGILYMLFTFALIVAIMYLINPSYDYWLTGYGKYFLGALFVVFFWEAGYKRIKGNVSIYTKDSYLSKHRKFVLFLRGFECDKYEIGDENSNTSINNPNFDENQFVYICENYIPTCAIGMTKEGYAPFGADRVYVEDETWKADVYELMEKAVMIFILVNDRPSCVWEIRQSFNLLGKTIFFVDNLEKYDIVREQIKDIYYLPSASEKDVEIPFYVEFVKDCNNEDNMIPILYNYEPTEDEYKELVKYQLEKRGTL